MGLESPLVVKLLLDVDLLLQFTDGDTRHQINSVVDMGAEADLRVGGLRLVLSCVHVGVLCEVTKALLD